MAHPDIERELTKSRLDQVNSWWGLVDRMPMKAPDGAMLIEPGDVVVVDDVAMLWDRSAGKDAMKPAAIQSLRDADLDLML
jgi:hypothetical protein